MKKKLSKPEKTLKRKIQGERKIQCGAIRLYPSDLEKIFNKFGSKQLFVDYACKVLLGVVPVVISKPAVCDLWDFIELCIK